MSMPNSVPASSGLPFIDAAAKIRFAPMTVEEGMPSVPVTAYFESPPPHEATASAVTSIDDKRRDNPCSMDKMFGPGRPEGNERMKRCASVAALKKEAL
jgi:hypothetical protein